jgi:hypothetical protein
MCLTQFEIFEPRQEPAQSPFPRPFTRDNGPVSDAWLYK